MRARRWIWMGFLLVLAAVSFALASRTLSVGFDMMNQDSDASVGVGLTVIAAILGMLVAVTPWLVTEIIDAAREIRRQSREARDRFNAPLAVLALASLGALGGCTRVGAGHVAIKVNMAGDDRGVEEIPVETGWVWYNPISTSVFEYPTFVQTGAWDDEDQITFNSIEGLVIRGEISMSYEIERDKIPEFYVKFREDDLDDFTRGFMHNVARDAFNEIACKMTVEQIYGVGKEQLIADVRARVNRELTPYGISIVQLGFIGKPKLPESVEESINMKIAAMQNAQRTENEVAQTEAEARKVVAKAKGEADANALLTASITRDLIEWRRLEIERSMIDKWDGRRPLVEGSGSGMMLQLPVPMQQP